MKLRSIFIFSILIIGQELFAQEETEAAIPAAGNHFSIGFDYAKLGSFLLDFETKFEGQVGLLLGSKYHIAFEYGYAEFKPEEAFENADYVSSGNYWRAGADYHVTMTPKNSLFIGVRYGSSSFDDEFKVTVGSQLFPDYELNRNGLEASWYELGLATETFIIPSLAAGLKLKLKILGTFDDPDPLDPYAIPGYGRSFDKTIPNLNLYVKYMIRF